MTDSLITAPLYVVGYINKLNINDQYISVTSHDNQTWIHFLFIVVPQPPGSHPFFSIPPHLTRGIHSLAEPLSHWPTSCQPLLLPLKLLDRGIYFFPFSSTSPLPGRLYSTSINLLYGIKPACLRFASLSPRQPPLRY